ncbi:MAG: ribosome recycling factor, partial [Actinobacteria bacterium]
SQLITINPWDKSTIAAIEKAILSSELGITPSNDGNLIRLSLPPLTEERRKELTKVVHNLGEEAKVSIRNIRREANEDLKKLKDDGKISEDDYFREHDVVQKVTDDHTKKIDEIIKAKEEDLMSV